MHIQTDVLVIGGGIAGLSAALAAATRGRDVCLVSNGAGTVAISTGTIDLLGLVEGVEVSDPWAALEKLPQVHPYSLLGRERIATALQAFQNILASQNMPYTVAEKEGKKLNTNLPTILGTMKPSYLIPAALDSRPLASARSILVCGVEGLRDISPRLCRDQLKRDPSITTQNIVATMLPSPFAHIHRGITALDIARHVNSDAGLRWLETSLGRYIGAFDVILMPPILGTSKNGELLAHFRKLLISHVEELLSIPPGVGGLRLREALIREAGRLKVRFVENAEIVRAQCLSGRCVSVSAAGSDPLTISARSYVLATGGILGGGILTSPFEATEKLFHLPLTPVPTGDDEVTVRREALLSLGVMADKDLRPVNDQGKVVLQNVFLAGRILGGYDFAREKSGHGVAVATGWTSGTLASDFTFGEAAS